MCVNGYTPSQRIPKYVPFANGLITNKKCDLLIRDEKQSSWNLKLHSCKTQTFIGDGWRKFSADKCLKVGDRIMFEIVTDSDTPIWKFRVVTNAKTPMRKFQGKFSHLTTLSICILCHLLRSTYYSFLSFAIHNLELTIKNTPKVS